MFIFQTFNKISVIINISRGRTPGQAISAVFVFVTFSERCKKKKKKEKKTTTKKRFKRVGVGLKKKQKKTTKTGLTTLFY